MPLAGFSKRPDLVLTEDEDALTFDVAMIFEKHIC